MNKRNKSYIVAGLFFATLALSASWSSYNTYTEIVSRLNLVIGGVILGFLLIDKLEEMYR